MSPVPDYRRGIALIILGAVLIALDFWWLTTVHWAAGPRGQNGVPGVVGLIVLVSGVAVLLGYRLKA